MNKNDKNEKDPWEEVFGLIIRHNEIKSQARDNLFSANHRGLMLRQHGYTEAERVTINDLII